MTSQHITRAADRLHAAVTAALTIPDPAARRIAVLAAANGAMDDIEQAIKAQPHASDDALIAAATSAARLAA